MFDLDLDEKISFKYADNVPEGYGISEIQYTFDFINLVFKEDVDIESSIRRVAEEYDLDKFEFKKYLIDNKYILTKIDKKDFSNQIKKYTTKHLKRILKSNGLRKSGKRHNLEKRILENNLLGNSEYLSSKSRIFHKNKKRRIRIFNDFLKDYYYFDEFNEYYMDNYRKKEDKIPVEFVKVFIRKAFDDKNHSEYVLNNQVISEIFYKKEKFKLMLENVLKNYCININPIWKLNDLENHQGIPIFIYDELLFLKERMGKNRIISVYYVVWDSFNFDEIIVSKYLGYRYLKDLLNLKDYDKILKDLSGKFYSNESLKIKKITQKTLFDF